MGNTIHGGKNTKIIIIGALLSVLIILAVAVTVLTSKPRTTASNNAVTTNDSTEQTSEKEKSLKAISQATEPPKASFSTWTGLDQPPGLPTALGVYSLKQSFTPDEASALAQKLQANGFVKQDKDIMTAYTVLDQNNAAFLVFNMKSGEFSYRSSKGVPLPAGERVEDRAYAFLRSLGWYDPTIQVSATYRNSKKPGVLYVEVHRNWSDANAPILSPVGVLNIPEEQSLSSLTLNTNLANTPKDTTIYATTDNRNGYARATDFNTMTLGIDEGNQTVTMITSNLRPVKTSNPGTPLIGYDQAVDRLKNNQYTYIYTTPSGSGVGIDWEKIYPGNLANAREAKVTEATVAYLEQSPSVIQTTLEPYYIFRGHADLVSGYRVEFSAAVPATNKGPLTSDKTMLASVKGIFAQANDSTQKQGTFELDDPGTPAPSSNTNVPTVPGTCQPSAAELNPVYQANGLTFGWAPYTYWKGEYRDSKGGYWYYVPDQGVTASIVEGNLDSIIAALLQATPGKVDVRDELKKIQYDIQQNIPGSQQFAEGATPANDNTQKQDSFYPTGSPEVPTVLNTIFNTILAGTTACPVRLTGSSPSVFVYGHVGAHISVSPVDTVMYADPLPDTGNNWNVVVHGVNDLEVNGAERPYIYYEYKKVAFSRPHSGWNVERSGIEEWVRNTIGKKMALTEKEVARMVFEVRHAASKVEGNSLFVGLIDTDELASLLPLRVTGAELTRIHVYVGPQRGQVQAPVLSPLVRPQNLVLELGSHAE